MQRMTQTDEQDMGMSRQSVNRGSEVLGANQAEEAAAQTQTTAAAAEEQNASIEEMRAVSETGDVQQQ